MCYKSCIFSLTLCIELQIWMNVTKGPIIVILMQLAIILKGAIVAHATLDLRAMVFLAQVITCPFLISSLELYVSKSSVQFSSIEGAVGTYFNLCKLGVCVCVCGELMYGIKIPLQDFVLQIQGGEGAYLWDTMVYETLYQYINCIFCQLLFYSSYFMACELQM